MFGSLPIYEGTNGIQAMDLVTRKLADGGEAAHALLDEIEETAEAARAVLTDLAAPLWEAAENLRETTDWMVAQAKPAERHAGAAAYLAAFARVLGAHFHLRAALAEGADGPYTVLARIYIFRLLPESQAHLAEARAGAADLFAYDLGGAA